MFNSGLELGAKTLEHLGFTRYEAYRSSRIFKHHEEDVLLELYEHWQEGQSHFIQETRRFSEQLSETLQTEKDYSIHNTDCAWDVESVKQEPEIDLNPEKKG